MRRTGIILLLIMALVYIASCAPGVSQEEYDDINSQLESARNQITSLQGKLDEAVVLKAQNEVLLQQNKQVMGELELAQDEYDDLAAKSEMATKEFENLQDRYQKLSSDYQALEGLCQQVEAVPEEPEEIVPEEVEQVLFELINQERKNKGMAELTWGVYLYREAQLNSRSMAENQRLEYAKAGSYQEAFRATGYADMDTMIDAVLTIWRNTENYELKFLNEITPYGAVAVYKLEDIYNISYIASIFK